MKKFYERSRLLLSVFLYLISAEAVFAQPDFKHCGFTEKYLERLRANPEIIKEEEKLEKFTREFEEQVKTQKQQSSSVKVIPVVFHIIHQYGSENISDAQVIDAVRIINEDFRKLNADTSVIVPAFKNIATDANIEFRLAKLDPNGNCTNGIDRIASVQTNIGDDGSKLNPWDRKKYLNVWVVKTISSGAAGYAYYPSSVVTSPNIDGIVILSNYVGSIGTGSYTLARALTHEIGHYLNLAHVWGSTNQPGVSCGDDGVADTPETKGYTSCSLSNSDICNAGIEENVQNFMEYAYCSRMFTAGQVTRMQAALNSSISSRNNLWTSANLAATGVDNPNPVTCAPKADFTPWDYNVICEGSSITFKDVSFNGPVTSRIWTFNGGSPSTDTASNPTVTYNTAGTYDVTLSVSNAAGTNTKTLAGRVIVIPATAGYAPTYTMNFEDANAYTNQIIVLNQDNDAKKWNRFTTTGYNSSACIRMDALNAPKGAIDEFMIPSIDLQGVTNIQVTFYYSTKLKTTDQTDKLRTLVSANCGQTWSPRSTLSGTSLAYDANATQSTAFTPTSSSMWKMATVNIPSIFAKPNTLIKFEFTAGGGNNIYIDNINILGVVGINEINNLSEVVNFSIVPNPANISSTVSFNLPTGLENASLKVYNLMGQKVSDLYQGGLHPGNYSFELSKEQLGAAGIYMVKLDLDGRQLVQKLILN